MGTVQGYIQGLERGAINKNCTFIIVKATPTTFSWEDEKLTLTRMITFRDPDGCYHTTVTKIQDNIYGTYFAWEVDAHTILAVFDEVDLTHIKLQIAVVHNDVYGMAKAVGVPVWKILAKYAPIIHVRLKG